MVCNYPFLKKWKRCFKCYSSKPSLSIDVYVCFICSSPTN